MSKHDIEENSKIFFSICSTPLCFIPLYFSSGFTECLRGATGGQAFPQLVFDHWQLLPGDPLEATSLAGGVVQETRLMKGLGANVPNLDVFLDKL